MPVQRRRNSYGKTELALELIHNFGQIALQVDPERQEVREHQYLFRSGLR